MTRSDSGSDANRILEIGHESVTFPCDIVQVAEFGENTIVRLDPIASDRTPELKGRNIVALDGSGTRLWVVEMSKTRVPGGIGKPDQPDSFYGMMWTSPGRLKVTTFRGVSYFVDLETGTLSGRNNPVGRW